uniref:Uncharacterized protein n=1 Tax=Anguilla anguilla TaxID=7936 RepID=A0A0E9TFI9_ANGAN
MWKKTGLRVQAVLAGFSLCLYLCHQIGSRIFPALWLWFHCISGLTRHSHKHL